MARRGPRDWVAGWPLRRRLAAMLMVTLAAGLLVAGFAAVASLRGYLIGEVDRSLAQMAGRASSLRSLPGDPPGQGGPSGPGPTGQERTYVRYLDSTGAEVAVLAPTDLTDPPDLPDLTVEQAVERSGDAYTVTSESGSNRWRALTMPLRGGAGSVTVAVDISGITATVARLAWLELAIGLIVLASVGLAGWLMVRRSLRPLEGVEHAAAAIAAGNLAMRAPPADPRTEVGSLAVSFNTMVDELQGAFDAQRASERSARSAADAAQASESRMRQFVADASHELRTPLTSVRGFAELYRIGAVPHADLPATMGRIEAEASRMGVLVEDLLLLARLDQQRPLEQVPVDVLGVCTDAVVAARATAPARDIRVSGGRGSQPPVVLGDAVRLRQVVDNLLSNAVRYSPEESPVLVRVAVLEGGVQPAPEPGEGIAGLAAPFGIVRVEVEDRGTGMSEQEAARAFERFYRADPARARAAGGAGLGLAIVAAIATAHGGRVAVRTAPGAGSVFRLDLPAAAPADRTPPE